MMKTENYPVLKELALKFKSSGDPVVFEKIIVKVEKLLLLTIHRARKAKPYLKRVELEDLFQIAVLGLYRALSKVKEEEPGSKLLYLITRYVGNEIAKCYKSTNRVLFPFSVSKTAFQMHLCFIDMPQSQEYIDQIENRLIENALVYKNLEMEFIRERFSKLLEEGVFSSEEFEMIGMRFIDDMTYVDIAKQFGCSNIVVSKKINDVLNRIRWEFRRRGWEGI